MIKDFVSTMDFKALDRLSESPTLTVRGWNRYRTKTGAIISLVAYFFVVLYVTFEIWGLFMANVKTTSSKNFHLSSKVGIDVQSSKLLPIVSAIQSEDPSILPIPLFDIFNVRIRFMFSGFRANSKDKIQPVDVYFRPCSELQKADFDKYYTSTLEAEAQSMLPKLYCVDIPTLEQKIKDSSKKFGLNSSSVPVFSDDVGYILDIFPCNPAVGAKCKTLTDPERKKLFAGKYAVAISTLEPSVNSNDFSEPVKYSILNTNKKIFPQTTFTLEYEEEMMVNYINDQSQFSSSASEKMRYVTKASKFEYFYEAPVPITCAVATIDNNTCKPYSRIIVAPNTRNEASETLRKFKTIIETASNIGGFYTAVWATLTVTYALILPKLGKKELVKDIFIGGNEKKGDTTKIRDPEHILEENRKLAAVKVLDECLDVYTLVRQFMLLRVLLDYLLDPRSQKLGLMMAMNNHLNEAEEEMQTKKDVKDTASIGDDEDEDTVRRRNNKALKYASFQDLAKEFDFNIRENQGVPSDSMNMFSGKNSKIASALNEEFQSSVKTKIKPGAGKGRSKSVIKPIDDPMDDFDPKSRIPDHFKYRPPTGFKADALKISDTSKKDKDRTTTNYTGFL